MKHYIMINHGVGKPDAWDEYFSMLTDNGHLIGGSSLGSGIAVRKKVFSKAKSKTVTGFIVIQAKDIREAKKIMYQSPVHLSGGTVELFPFVES